MTWTTQPPHERTAAETGLSDHLLALLSSAAGYFAARLELAGLEGKEAFAAYGKVFLFLAAGAALVLFGYLFLWIGLVAVVAFYSGIHWGWLTLGAGVVHLLGTAACLWAAKTFWGVPVFQATLQEFRKDQEWLGNPNANRN